MQERLIIQILELVLLGTGLSFDTFAVSVSAGLRNSEIRFREAVYIAFVLAFFQSAMPFLGWLGGSQVQKYIRSADHWVAFGLLFILGARMIIESFRTGKKEQSPRPMMFSTLIMIAIATSIDALVVGITLAFADYNIYLAIAIIGAVTFLVSMIGMLLGKNVNEKFGRKAEIAGGLILIGIGIKILIEHLLST